MMPVDALLAEVKWDTSGLCPVVVFDRPTGVPRMLAWANRAAVEQTGTAGLATFWSRSRQALWQKGESSGHHFHVDEIRIDCDGDSLLYLGHADGPTCHTGAASCFFRSVADGAPLGKDDGPAAVPSSVIERVAAVIADRRRERPDKSYVVTLLDGGWDKILGKIREEAAEVIEALPRGDRAHTAHEAADVLFHLLVGLEQAGVPTADVFAELGRRFGVSGLEEKSARRRTATQPGR